MMGKYAYISFSVPLSPYSLMTTTKPGSGYWAHMSAVAIYPVPIGHLLCPLRGLTLQAFSESTFESSGLFKHGNLFPLIVPGQLRTPCVSCVALILKHTRWSQLISIGPNWSCNWIVSASIDQTLKDKGYHGDPVALSNVDLPDGFQPLCCPPLQGSTTPTNVPHRS